MEVRKRSGIEKNRTSLEMGIDEYSDLEYYSKETGSTVGRMINRLIQIFGNMEPRCISQFTRLARAKSNKLLSLMEECSAFEKANLESQRRFYVALLWYLTEDAENIEGYAKINVQKSKESKKRTTLDLTPENYKVLSAISDKFGITFGEAVGLLTKLFISMPPTCRKDLLFFTRNQIRQILDIEAKIGALEAGENDKVIRDYQTISYFFESGQLPLAATTANMKRIYLKDGYVEFPNDWIYLPNVLGQAEECLYAGVIETRNSQKYGVPHFIFASPYKHGYMYTDSDRKIIFDAAIKAWPEFKKILNMHVAAEYNENGLISNEKEYMEAPYAGIFAVYSEDDIEMKTLHHGVPPYGTKIVKNKEENSND